MHAVRSEGSDGQDDIQVAVRGVCSGREPEGAQEEGKKPGGEGDQGQVQCGEIDQEEAQGHLFPQ